MIARIIELVRRLTSLERVLVLWIAAAPIAYGVIVLLGVVVHAALAALIVLLSYYVAGVAGAAIAIALRLRRRRRFERNLVRPSFVVPPQELGARGVLADEPEPWARIDSPALEQLRVVRRVAHIARGPLLFFGMRTKSMWIREPFTYLVTGGQFDYATLARLLDPQDLGGEHGDLLLSRLDLDFLLSLSRLVASQNIDPRDQEISLVILRFVTRHVKTAAATVHRRRVSKGNLLYLAERTILAGELESAHSLVANLETTGFTESLLKADVMNPFHPNRLQRSEDLWLTAFNAIYAPFGLEPVRLQPTGASPYDRLQADIGDLVTEGPLISVIMTCYRPDHTLESAVRSMISQTWQNWELIIVDDGSPEEFHGLLNEVAATDSRIRVLLSTDNRGTYVRRNDAIQASRGELITMHDSDDWAHPRRLELQARHLLQNPREIANLSYSLRVSENLMFVQPRGATMRLTESSILFRKKLVVDKIGYFDNVRKAADGEYRLRIEAAFHTSVSIVDTLGPLALVRYTATSLSGSDLGDGWMHPARIAYLSAQELWRLRIGSGQADPYLAHPQLERPFPAHEHLLGVEQKHRDIDLLVVLDARVDAQPEGQLAIIAVELRKLAGAGLEVGIMQMYSLVDGRPPAILAAEVQELVNDGLIRAVLIEDDVRATTVIVRNASDLNGAPSVPCGITTDRTVIFEDTYSGKDLRAQNFARADAESAARQLFGVAPEWRVWDTPVSYDLLKLGSRHDVGRVVSASISE